MVKEMGQVKSSHELVAGIKRREDELEVTHGIVSGI